MVFLGRRDFWSGIMFSAVGAGFALQSSTYDIGTAARMGSGYFPFWTGIALFSMGAVVLMNSFARRSPDSQLGGIDWRVLLLVIGSVIVFASMLRYAGLYASIFVMVLISSAASHQFNWKIALANGVFLVLICYLVFIRGLGLAFPTWPVLWDGL